MISEHYERLSAAERNQLVDAAANPVLVRLLKTERHQLRDARLGMQKPDELTLESCMKFTLQFDDLTRRENMVGNLVDTLQQCLEENNIGVDRAVASV